MSIQGQSILLWTTPVAGVLFLVAFFFFPGFNPPMSPTMTPGEVAEFFKENVAAIRAVAIFSNIICGTLVPFFALIVIHMLRVKNSSPVFAYSYLMCSGVGLTAFILADYCWAIAAFRPERDPQLISLLNDMAWLFFITPAGLLIVQNLCLALSIYLDENISPVFPRWVAHFNVATAILMAPGAFAAANKSGPFAWDGSLAFHLRLATFAVYVAVMFLVLVGVIRRQAEAERMTVCTNR